MARPKSKSKLTEGISELVESIRGIESKLNILLKFYAKMKSSVKVGRPKGSGKKRKPGRPPGIKKPGRPPGKKRRGRPLGS